MKTRPENYDGVIAITKRTSHMYMLFMSRLKRWFARVHIFPICKRYFVDFLAMLLLTPIIRYRLVLLACNAIAAKFVQSKKRKRANNHTTYVQRANK